ncbi:uncharacterized protein BKA78DRAFT_306638 [Phyllosticta capitalensis]|uniref:uncharacterized protein n=1 Tax=Phyllosticta capitalensis TaxID=121624 RepID=UPI00312E1378
MMRCPPFRTSNQGGRATTTTRGQVAQTPHHPEHAPPPLPAPTSQQQQSSSAAAPRSREICPNLVLAVSQQRRPIARRPLRTPQSTYVHHCCTPSDGGGGGEYTCRHGHGEGAGVAGGVPWPARDKRPWLWAWRRGGRAERSLIAHRARVTGPSQRRARHLRRCDAQGTCGGDFTARP